MAPPEVRSSICSKAYLSDGRRASANRIDLRLALHLPYVGCNALISPTEVVLALTKKPRFSVYGPVSDRVELVVPILVPLRKVTIYMAELGNVGVFNVDRGNKGYVCFSCLGLY